jgi:hypothetical protein
MVVVEVTHDVVEVARYVDEIRQTEVSSRVKTFSKNLITRLPVQNLE